MALPLGDETTSGDLLVSKYATIALVMPRALPSFLGKCL